MAAYMTLHKYGSPHQEPLRDPLLYDTVLSAEGLRQVRALVPALASLKPPPELVLSSPLTR
jgi:broad specificity phosphatase PhoE